MQINSNLSIETTRKKALEIMQKGMIAYKLANLGWDVSEHYGDGFDLLCLQTIFNEIEPKGHFVMSIQQAFNAVKNKGTSKFEQYKDFSIFQEAAMETSQKKILLRKGNKEKLTRFALDIGCTFKKFKEDKWELGIFKDRWDNLLQ